jgi:type II secretory pathway predicted ATPase ExeA
MYEVSFGLKRRPFAATPDGTCFLSAGPIQAALDEIVVCIEQGQGIAVLTAPAGVGKTLLCEKLESELNPRFQTVFLRHSSFLTRRALLQTLLCELNHSYHQPSEQELRLELFPAIRALRSEREALVIICDEAHHLTESLIEELRILADFAESGRPLVRLILVGQLALEEKLAQPSLEAFNQRIRAHVNLPTFDRAGSLDYIDYRLTWGGGRTDEIFTSEALEVIVRASDGIPRCINQLADHSLLLAFVAEQSPVKEEIVLEALNDLRQLPLHWNESSISRSSLAMRESDLDQHEAVVKYQDSNEDTTKPNVMGKSYAFESSVPDGGKEDLSSGTVSFEIGADREQPTEDVSLPAEEVLESAATLEVTFETPDQLNQIAIDATSDDWRQAIHLFSVSRNKAEITTAAVSSPAIKPSKVFHEELVIDRYAIIDAGLPPIVSSIPDTVEPQQVRALQLAVEPPINLNPLEWSDPDDFTEFDTDIAAFRQQPAKAKSPQSEILEILLGEVHDLIEVVSDVPTSEDSKTEIEIDPLAMGTARIDSAHEVSGPAGIATADDERILNSFRREEGDYAAVDYANSIRGSNIHDANQVAWESVETNPVEITEKARPFRYLFSMLRRKQQQSN